jgi:fatty acid-binding protein DegV
MFYYNLPMHKLALVLDSSSGIKNGEFEHVYVVPLIINEDVGGKITPYKDNVDIDSNSLSKKLIEGANIKTSQSSIGENMQLLEDLTSKYEKVVVVPIPSTISGNLQS